MAAAEHPRVDLRVNLDERASAYYAAGYTRATGHAAAVICTSGTAAVNLFPAVVEAYQSRLPLVLLTADRPEELQNCGANQTINQEDLFGQYAACLNIPAPSDDFDPAQLLEKLDTAFEGILSTPVHINCRFREPLVPAAEPYDYDTMKARLDDWRSRHQQDNTDNLPGVSDQETSGIVSLMNEKKRGLIVAGPDTPFRASNTILELSKKLKWPIAADILSQCRHSDTDNVITYYDLFLNTIAIKNDLRPEIIVHVGGLPTSKRLNRFLLECKGIEYIKIQDHDRTIDPDNLETKRIVCPIDQFLEGLNSRMEQRDNEKFLNTWINSDKMSSRVLERMLGSETLDEITLAYRLGKTLNDDDALFLSNSMPVRDADSYTVLPSADIIVGANRGASGIDGVIASACGFAAGSLRTTTLIIGDLAFIHDLNSLDMVRRSEMPVIIIVVNNDGGGIFHFLPIARFTDQFEKYFGTPHGLGFENAAALFGLDYFHPESLEQFEKCYTDVKELKKSAIIEITCDRHQNVYFHQKIRSAIKAAITLSKDETG